MNTLYCVYSLRKWCQGLDKDTDKEGGDGVVNHTHTYRHHTQFDLDFGWYIPPLMNMLRIIPPLLLLLETDAYLEDNGEHTGETIGERGRKKEIWQVCVCVCMCI